MQERCLKSPRWPQLTQGPSLEALNVLLSLNVRHVLLAHGSFPPLRTELCHGQGVIHVPVQAPFMMT